ncbi:hypothetical protein FNO01nite_25370 [Flavobacterium noncentrifugens]|nr:hypothetical protein FNO01nite_25370 [Flavobacterium noncentrifugens]
MISSQIYKKTYNKIIFFDLKGISVFTIIFIVRICLIHSKNVNLLVLTSISTFVKAEFYNKKRLKRNEVPIQTTIFISLKFKDYDIRFKENLFENNEVVRDNDRGNFIADVFTSHAVSRNNCFRSKKSRQ